MPHGQDTPPRKCSAGAPYRCLGCSWSCDGRVDASKLASHQKCRKTTTAWGRKTYAMVIGWGAVREPTRWTPQPCWRTRPGRRARRASSSSCTGHTGKRGGGRLSAQNPSGNGAPNENGAFVFVGVGALPQCRWKTSLRRFLNLRAHVMQDRVRAVPQRQMQQRRRSPPFIDNYAAKGK